LARRIREVETLVTNEARTIKPQPKLANRQLWRASCRVPVEADEPLTLAAFDEHLVAMHRHEHL
jgi:hypothetical protein